MDQAYIFPKRVSVGEGNLHQATLVELDDDHAELVRASDHGRLRCPYAKCLEPVMVVHEPAGSSHVKCFRHYPVESSSPYCIYRVAWHWPEDPTSAPSDRRGTDPRKILEALLHGQLARALSARGQVRITASDPGDRLPRLWITGLGPPLRILSLAPGDGPLWGEDFDGTEDGEQVLFFVAGWDLRKLRARPLDRRVLAVRPGIAVFPARPGSPADTWSIVAERALGRDSKEALAELDLRYVDHGKLCGQDRPPEYLFLKAAGRRALDLVEEKLAREGLSPALRKVLRRIAQRLLAEGAGVRYAEPGAPSPEERDLQLKAEGLEIWDAAPALREQLEAPLRPPFEALHRDFLLRLMARVEELAGELYRVRKSEGTAVDGWRTSRDSEKELREKLREAEGRHEELERQLRAAQDSESRLRTRSEKLAGELRRELREAGEARATLERKASAGRWLIAGLAAAVVALLVLLALRGPGPADEAAGTGPRPETGAAVRRDRPEVSAGTAAEVAVLRGHAATVRHAAFRPDGRRVVTVDGEGAARWWDTSTGDALAVFGAGAGAVIHAAVSADGGRVVTTGGDGEARLWDAATGAALAVLTGHRGAVVQADFDPGGSRVVTAGEDSTARVWEAATGGPLTVLRGHEGAVRQARFSPTGLRIATAGDDGTVRLWNPESGRLLRVLHGDEPIRGTFFRDRERRLAAEGVYGTVWEWSLETGRQLAKVPGPHPDEFSLFSLSGDAGLAAVAYHGDSGVALHAIFDNTSPVTLQGHGCDVRNAAFSSDSSRVVTASCDGTARVWETHGGRLLAIAGGHGRPVSYAVFSPGDDLLLTADDPGEVRLYRLSRASS